ncbi:SANT/Myb domain [Dillenia turbinata]|uniref:SANT/Myb domain n=1 Tax=Dillenia turbinata TaxID=194707 RepID=A0AAN8V8Z2_9MAGN
MMFQENQGEQSSGWTRKEDKIFEEALVMVPEDVQNRWEVIAEYLPGKSAAEVREHYEKLVHDILEIDAGRVELPSYTDEFARHGSGWDDDGSRAQPGQISFGLRPKPSTDVDRKKGTPWSEDEHRRFLQGLKLYGKGDWRSISRNAVVTRTPTQVASHAQKYFLRQNSGKKERKRSSIHDITETNMSSSPPLPPPPPGPVAAPSPGLFF